MDRRTIMGMALFVAVYALWMSVRPKPEPPPEVEAGQELPAAPAPVVPASPLPAPTSGGPVREVPFTACGAEGTYSTAYGLRDVVLPDYEGPLHIQPLYLWVAGLFTGGDTQWKPWGEPPGPAKVISPEGRMLAVGVGPWSPEPVNLQIVQSSASELTLRGRSGDIDITRTLVEKRDESLETCVIEVHTTFTNAGSGPVSTPLWIEAHDHVAEPGGSMVGRYDSASQPLLHVDGSLAYGNNAGAKVGGCLGIGGIEPTQPGAPVAIDGPVEWFGIGDRYFGFLVVSDTDGAVGHFSTSTGEDAPEPIAGSYIEFTPTLAPGQSQESVLRAYVGPLNGPSLSGIEATLTDAVDLGFFAIFGYPLLWLLRIYQSLVVNWGVAIILLTVTVKLLFFPMTQSSFRSMQNMQRIQPEMNRIREEFAADPQEMNRLTMDLMMREKVNPLSGCLPMVAQTPVWIALYNVLLSSVDLYHTEFLYLRDLSVPDPYCVLPLAVIILMLVQQQFTNTSNMDPAQARMMKFMPLMFGILFFTFPSGLAVYMFVNMSGSILQQWWIKRSLGEYPAQAVM